jgi:hypothetical protein
MEEKLDELLAHIRENTVFFYSKDISNEYLMQNLMDRGFQFLTKPKDQNIVDLCTLALVLYLRKTK